MSGQTDTGINMYAGEDLCTCLHINVREFGKICAYFINYSRGKKKKSQKWFEACGARKSMPAII